jgi:hypothetical protein
VDPRLATKESNFYNVKPEPKFIQSPPMPASILSSLWFPAELSSTADVETKPESTNVLQLPPMPSPVSSAVEPRLAAKELNLDEVKPEPKYTANLLRDCDSCGCHRNNMPIVEGVCEKCNFKCPMGWESYGYSRCSVLELTNVYKFLLP